MNKAEYLKKQLAELSEVINTFSSEAVQLRTVSPHTKRYVYMKASASSSMGGGQSRLQ